MKILLLKVPLVAGENVIWNVALAPLATVTGRPEVLAAVNACEFTFTPVISVGRQLVFVTTSGWVWLLLTATPLKTRLLVLGLSAQENRFCAMPVPVRRSVKAMRTRIKAIAFCCWGLLFPTVHPSQRLLRCLRGLWDDSPYSDGRGTHGYNQPPKKLGGVHPRRVCAHTGQLGRCREYIRVTRKCIVCSNPSTGRILRAFNLVRPVVFRISNG